MQLQQGYKDRYRYSSINKVEYIHNLSSLVKGLELRAAVSLTKASLSEKRFTTTPYTYALDRYDEETGKHYLNAINADGANPTLQLNSSDEKGETDDI